MKVAIAGGIGVTRNTEPNWSGIGRCGEISAVNAMELLFTPCIYQDIPALFLQQISQSDPTAVQFIIQAQAGFPVAADDSRAACQREVATPATLPPRTQPGGKIRRSRAGSSLPSPRSVFAQTRGSHHRRTPSLADRSDESGGANERRQVAQRTKQWRTNLKYNC